MEIYRSSVDSPRKRPVMRGFDVSFDVSLSQLLNKQSIGMLSLGAHSNSLKFNKNSTQAKQNKAKQNQVRAVWGSLFIATH